MSAWGAFFAPTGTPRAIIDKLNAAIVKAMAHLDTQAFLATAGSEAMSTTPEQLGAFLVAEMKRWGDVVLDWYTVNSDYSRFPAVFNKALATRPDLFFLENATAALALAPLTKTVPIVAALMGDPVGAGLVKSLAHPDANMTGISMMVTDIMARRLQMLKEIMPDLKRIGVLKDAGIAFHDKWVETLTEAGKVLGITLSVAAVSKPNELALAYASLRKRKAQADKDRIPASFGSRRWVQQGALLSYSASFDWMFHRSAYYVDRILKGKKPSELPIEQPMKFELAVNQKVAKKLGLKIPESIHVQATHLFE